MSNYTQEIDSQIDPKEWVNTYADYLYAFARKRIDSEEQAKDLVQDTFLAALEKRSSFKGLSTERTWLVSILKYKIIDSYRKKAAMKYEHKETLEDLQDTNAFFEDNGHWEKQFRPAAFGIENIDVLEKKEFEQILKSCLEKLPVLWSAVFTMKHLDEEESQEICTALHISPSNFWVIMHRAKIGLRACLGKNWQK